MFILFIIGIIIGALAIVFALQNIVPITVAFLAWHFEGSLSLILMIAVLAGALVSALLTVPETIMNYFRFKDLEKKLAVDEKIINEQKAATAAVAADVAKTKADLEETPRL